MDSSSASISQDMMDVLVGQAPKSASIALIFAIVTVVSLLLFWRSFAKFEKQQKYGDEPIVVIFCILCFATIVAAVFIACSVPYILYGFTSPEYWAIRQVL